MVSNSSYVQIPGASFLAACSLRTFVDPESRGFFAKTPNGTSCGMIANTHVSIALRLGIHQPTHREIIVFGTVRSTNLSAIAIACLN
jgi:xanthine/uracil/vitamin C permease (AzgA family)